MAQLAFVDAHIHFWDLGDPRLTYSWLAPGVDHPILGNIDAIKFPLYAAEEFRRETAEDNVTKTVHVQAAIGTADPVDETRWLQEQADSTGLPHAIVAYADLKDPDVDRVLEQHVEASPLMRGIRDFSNGDFLTDPAFERGLSKLAARGLVCDIECFWQDMPKARDLAGRHPDAIVAVDHAGFPRERTDAYFADWKSGIRKLAEAENVVCKISGLGMGDFEWTVDSIRPWVLHCIEAFGAERCVMGTNWPVDKLFSSYGAVVDAYAGILSDFSHDEQVALFSGNAERIFRI
ncbi:amidohydrolase family protein [Conexibacter woesei]|uniref:Amidohydrolase 2 n=1 Tax=Conexibacter woesei (strain DSM 14684 / CCUG 47730 / CIP 108061 / JCM 11494 / NBRC 100937 / ID131577) TaxID=469383 RepID=D3FCJ0_CONWI|nr:amidohydrolase family protein [Conexibacter woesei]ADB49463.1 amidohydrolase 2 [Conexibacter woesei DSM 14684]